jgi:thiosulfate dehydrogenase
VKLAFRTAAAALTLAAVTACSPSAKPNTQAAQPPVYDPSAVPAGAVGDSVRYGREVLMNTRKILPGNVTVRMDCAACHVNGGTVARGGSLAGVAAQFPQWNKRAHRVIALEDRLAECFLYSMNGHPPPYDSREMEGLVAYITYLSRGTPLGSKPDPTVTLASITLPHPNTAAGGQLYAQKCALCHGAQGAGGGENPPLWGAGSFNDGAGMHRLRTMAGFVRYNMPKNAPGSLTDRQAFDIAAFVLAHPRPKFDKARLVMFPAAPAGYF